ncbi:hypothetical protein DL765_006728 [Monosporascus sp. GIB2]|nr:hypothetical protein DL765_006728 [Monosporascus sp. GIB2]
MMRTSLWWWMKMPMLMPAVVDILDTDGIVLTDAKLPVEDAILVDYALAVEDTVLVEDALIVDDGLVVNYVLPVADTLSVIDQDVVADTLYAKEKGPSLMELLFSVVDDNTSMLNVLADAVAVAAEPKLANSASRANLVSYITTTVKDRTIHKSKIQDIKSARA